MLNESVTNAQILEELRELKALLARHEINEHSRELWDVQKVADYFGFTYDHTFRNIVTSPHFPAPIDIQGRTGGKSKNLYVSGEVVSFCLRWKKRKARL